MGLHLDMGLHLNSHVTTYTLSVHEEIAGTNRNAIESKGHKLMDGDFAILSNYLILHILNIILLCD